MSPDPPPAKPEPGTTASGQAAFVNQDTQQALLQSAAASDTATVRSFVGLNVIPADLAQGGPVADRREMLRKGLALRDLSRPKDAKEQVALADAWSGGPRTSLQTPSSVF